MNNTFYTILNTQKNKDLGYNYKFHVEELPHPDLDHKKMFHNGSFVLSSDNSEELNNLLLKLYKSHQRVVLDYGNRETNESWGDNYGVTGRISRSTGNMPIPILVYNNRSYGGGAILDDVVISIKTSKGKILLWENKIS